MSQGPLSKYITVILVRVIFDPLPRVDIGCHTARTHLHKRDVLFDRPLVVCRYEKTVEKQSFKLDRVLCQSVKTQFAAKCCPLTHGARSSTVGAARQSKSRGPRN